MQLKINTEEYHFDPIELSIGKIQFELSEFIFPNSNLSHFIDDLLVDWINGLIELLQTKEQGDYTFSFQDFENDWEIEFEKDDKPLILSFLSNDSIVKSHIISLENLLLAIIPEIQRFATFCQGNRFSNEELIQLESDLIILKNLAAPYIKD